jgi:hypothetical protein
VFGDGRIGIAIQVLRILYKESGRDEAYANNTPSAADAGLW